ncbi:MAG: HEPN domain-containing protein [Prolixibacteraceae bacterium]|jgi:HEPN domain-containing protein|nr:HEPN domain-containing protein [Prolixibacteraceae bacterium]
MPNQKLALEWLDFARKSLETAILLNRENHYTDVIAIDIQQTIEKSLKSIYALNGEKIPRTHSLDILFNYASGYIEWSDIEIKSLIMISDYYQAERYPGPKYFMPDREEINKFILLAKSIFQQVADYIN